MENQDKRIYPRIEIKENGIIYIYDNDFECFVKDLSESGIAIIPDYTVPKLRINKIYEIGLINPCEDKPIYLKTLCIRNCNDVYGFKILYSDQKERDAVIDLLQVKIAEKFSRMRFDKG